MNKDIILDKYFSLPNFVKILIYALIWVLIAAGLYFTIITSQFETIEKKQYQLSKLKRQTLIIIRVKKKLKSFQAELKQLEKDFNIALKKLPDTKEIPSLLFNISEIGKKFNLDFLNFKPGAIEKKEFFAQIPISLRLTGHYHDIAKFLWEISNMQRIVKVKTLTLIPDKGTSLTFSGELETYIFLKESVNAKKRKKK